MREKGSGSREIFESSLLLHGIEVQPQWESISTQAILQAVGQGLGMAVLPLLLAQHDIAQGKICRVQIEGIPLARKFFVIHHKNKYRTAAMLAFIALCHACAAPA